METQEVISLARIVWDYHHMNHSLQRADCIFVLGSHDTRVAERAAELYLEGWAPLLLFSGGLGRLTQSVWTQTEADLFASIAMKKGVPAKSILIENKSTNTGENILFTRELLQKRGIDPQRFILVQKPYMERRTYATFLKQWPGKTFCVTSPQISFEDYPTQDAPMEKVIEIMVGDLQRIRLYAEKGFQVSQEIPEHVWEAYEKLVAAGFDKQMVKEKS
ncbi:MAG: YdcF family protein [Chitinophagaceae bacterium]|nr:MAG: YdcF family protein [Chitinophagaceae bacterium]